MLDLIPPLGEFVLPAAIFDKPGYSPFRQPAFRAWLDRHAVAGIVVTGAETGVCILSTVLAAVERGLRVTIVTDAVCSSSDRGHDALLDLYRRRFSEQVDVIETAQIRAIGAVHISSAFEPVGDLTRRR
jgi:nicotinamidase-related amidase